MKKLVSFFAAISMIASIPVFPVYAEEKTELENLAVSLGADRDYLAVPNKYYSSSDLTQSVLYDYFLPISSISQTMALESGVAKYSDTSFGASILSVLTHNGIISAADVTDASYEKKAESLSKINNILLAKNAIYKYQNVLDEEDFKLYTEYLYKSQNFEQKSDSLISTAEKCMNEGRYFLIMYSSLNDSPSFEESMKGYKRGQKAHSAVGIGITDGSWEFNGKTYDKCILTLDPMNVDDKNDAFSEDTCIYINSETKEYYMPKIFDSVESGIHIIAIDNDQLLNLEDTDVADSITSLEIARDSISEVTYKDSNGNEVFMNGDNDFLDNYHTTSNESFLVEGTDFKIYTASENEPDHIKIHNKDKKLDFYMEEADSEIFCNENTVKFTHKDSWGVTSRNPEDPLEFILYVKFADSEVEYHIIGETTTESEFTQSDNGVIFSGGKAILQKCRYHDPDDDGIICEMLGSISLNSNDKVFIQSDSDNSFKLFSDLDNDGIFEHEVKKGDLNCDGVIDSVDASIVLEAYSDISTNTIKNKNIYADVAYADMNSDGMIDAVDASALLEIYAQNSTN